MLFKLFLSTKHVLQVFLDLIGTTKVRKAYPLDKMIYNYKSILN